jgi:hypothetical protein
MIGQGTVRRSLMRCVLASFVLPLQHRESVSINEARHRSSIDYNAASGASMTAKCCWQSLLTTDEGPVLSTNDIFILRSTVVGGLRYTQGCPSGSPLPAIEPLSYLCSIKSSG